MKRAILNRVMMIMTREKMFRMIGFALVGLGCTLVVFVADDSAGVWQYRIMSC